MSDIFSAGASIAAASMQSSAIKDATEKQVKALERQKKFVYDNLQPATVQAGATAADIQRTQQRLALQSQVDPALLEARYVTQQNLLDIAKKGAATEGDKLAAQLYGEVSPKDAQAEQLRKKILDAAINEIDAGATLPPDVQAELVRAGLEQSGTVGAGSDRRGLAGQLTRRLIGNEALALKRARQDQATRLGIAAGELQNQRLGVLSSVFPQLKQLQVANAGLQSNILAQANQLTPEAGLGGTDIANIFLARVGATNQLTQGIADANAKQALGQAAAWSQALGTIGTVAGGGAKDAGSGSFGNILKGIF